MALVELRQGWCECGRELTLHVYMPYLKALQRLAAMGALDKYDDGDLEALFIEALEMDEYEADGGEVSMARTMAAATGGLFVDMSTEQVVTCPQCGRVVVAVAKMREG